MNDKYSFETINPPQEPELDVNKFEDISNKDTVQLPEMERSGIDTDSLHGENEPEKRLMDKIYLEELIAAAELGEREKTIITLREINNATLEEIRPFVGGISISSIKTIGDNALTKLKKAALLLENKIENDFNDFVNKKDFPKLSKLANLTKQEKNAFYHTRFAKSFESSTETFKKAENKLKYLHKIQGWLMAAAPSDLAINTDVETLVQQAKLKDLENKVLWLYEGEGLTIHEIEEALYGERGKPIIRPTYYTQVETGIRTAKRKLVKAYTRQILINKVREHFKPKDERPNQTSGKS
jgi:hypothetical protein